MDKDLVEMRIDFLKQMDNYIIKHGDTAVWRERLFNSFKAFIFTAIAENTDRWNSICTLFGELTEEEEN